MNESLVNNWTLFFGDDTAKLPVTSLFLISYALQFILSVFGILSNALFLVAILPTTLIPRSAKFVLNNVIASALIHSVYFFLKSTGSLVLAVKGDHRLFYVSPLLCYIAESPYVCCFFAQLFFAAVATVERLHTCLGFRMQNNASTLRYTRVAVAFVWLLVLLLRLYTYDSKLLRHISYCNTIMLFEESNSIKPSAMVVLVQIVTVILLKLTAYKNRT